MTVYSLYLSTSSVVNPPISKTDLASVKWNVNWSELFGGKKGYCKVKAKLISSTGAGAISWANNAGSLRASFQSNTTKSTNGFNIGAVLPIMEYVSNITYLDLDTSTTTGASIVIPNGNNDFYITFLDKTESLMTNVPEYQLWLYFDVDEEE